MLPQRRDQSFRLDEIGGNKAGMNTNAQPKQTAIEMGDPALNSKAFRRCLGQFGTGVTVMTARSGEIPVGMTANSFASVSLDPPLILWSVSSNSASAKAFASTDHFAVNVLARDQIALAQNFARHAEDKFAGVNWAPGLGGAPLIEGIAASLECRKEQQFDGGDHVIIVGRVDRFVRYQADGLLFVDGRYALAREHPGAASALETGQSLSELERLNTALMPLVTRVQRRLRRSFDKARDEFGVTRDESAALGGLAAYPGSTVDDLAAVLFLGANAVNEVVAKLAGSQSLTIDGDGKIELTQKGRELREALVQRYIEYEAEELEGIPQGDVEATERVLATLLTAPSDRQR